MPAATDHTPRLLLVCSLVFSVLAVSAAWREVPASTAWVLAAALLSLSACGWWVLHRSAARAGALQAHVQRLEARLEAFSIAQGRFVDSLAHEIKTPLTIVLNQAELLRRCSDDPVAVQNHAKSMADYLAHFSGLLDGFLRLGNPSAPSDKGQHEPVHFHDLVMEAVQRSQSTARSCGVSVATSLTMPGSKDAGPEVMGHAGLLEAMVESLVRSAVHFSPRGSCVALRVEVRGESVLLAVRDHGARIAASNLESVFDWFFEARRTTRKASGPIVGLAIARLIAEHHGGAISVRNHPEGGCEFEVTLPRFRAELPPSSTAAEVAEAPRLPEHPEPGTVAAEGQCP